MQKSLCLESLGDLDNGAAGLIIDAAIRSALSDLDDRGGDGIARKVEICLSVQCLDNGLIEAHVEAACRVPKRRTNSTIGRIKRDATQRTRLLFQDGDADDPDQRTLDEVSPDSFQQRKDQ